VDARRDCQGKRSPSRSPPGSKADWDNDREVAVGDFGRRCRKRGRALDQVKRLGIENSRTGALDDLAACDVAMPIDAEGEADHALGAAGSRRIALKAHETRYQRLPPARSPQRYRRWA
jgi:hypothetical protein